MTERTANLVNASVEVSLSTLFGALAGGVAATAYFAVLNFLANDGPYFPPGLVALLVVIPVALVLLPFQFAALAWRRVGGRPTLRGGWALGFISGVAAGLTLAFVVFAARHSVGDVLGFVGLGLIQGCSTLVTFAYLGSHRWPR